MKRNYLYTSDWIKTKYKWSDKVKTKYNWSDRAMRKEDNSPQGKIVTELLQVLTIITSFNLQLDLFIVFFT